MRTGAIVLAGGRSSRMGVDKALLDRDGISFVAHVVGVALDTLDGGPVVVAAAREQALPRFPAGVEVVRDATAGRGPLEGVAEGLTALSGRADAALVLATDLPLLVPELGRRLLALLDDGVDVVVPVVHGHRHPLAAAYRVPVVSVVERVLEEGQGRAGFVLERCRARFVGERELLADPALAAADPELVSLVNVNEPADLERVRALWRASAPPA